MRQQALVYSRKILVTNKSGYKRCINRSPVWP
ncbi:Uncharacterised protein [Vibrio cholerae]|nr:Uncharacterised protein [Vibrio cholerae]